MRARRGIAPALTGIILAAILTALIGGGTASAAKKESQKTDFHGSWRVTITGGPGTPPLPTWYGAHLNVVTDGGLIATITDPNIQTGHGSWTQVGKRKFAVTILLSQFDSKGDFLGTLKARATLKLGKKGRTFESDDYRFAFFDPNGAPTGFAGTGSAHGTRIKVER